MARLERIQTARQALVLLRQLHPLDRQPAPGR